MSSVLPGGQPERLSAVTAEDHTLSQFTVTFRGVRGSYPVPGRGTIEVGGNTPCVAVHAGEHLIVLDAGTGVIELGRELVASYTRELAAERTPLPIAVTLFFSHLHHDHTQGFPFFPPIYARGAVVYVYGPRIKRTDLEEALTSSLLSPFFPVALEETQGEVVIRHLDEDEVVVLRPGVREPHAVHSLRGGITPGPDDVVVRNAHGYAHPDGIRFYRVEYRGRSVVYATDTEGYVGGDVNLARFAQGADVLIHDAQYQDAEYAGLPGLPPRQGYGHSTPAMAAAVAATAGVRQLVLFHHDPAHDDDVIAEMEADARRLFAASVAAREGMTLDLLA